MNRCEWEGKKISSNLIRSSVLVVSLHSNDLAMKQSKKEVKPLTITSCTTLLLSA